jgi:hypothetical protein
VRTLTAGEWSILDYTVKRHPEPPAKIGEVMIPDEPSICKTYAFKFATVFILGLLWFGISVIFPAVGAMLVVLHSIFFLGDVGMNGWRDAEFAPFNAGGLICALAGVAVAGG